MSSAKVIENPEVPGLECFLPPPPPPPPPSQPPPPPPPLPPSPPAPPPSSSLSSIKPSNDIVSTMTLQREAITNENMITVAKTIETVSKTAAKLETSFPNTYILNATTQQRTTPGHPTTPWWVPSDSDSSDVYSHWYDPTYKGNAASHTPSHTLTKTKHKYYKRKNEFVDPAQDAEKVASAQRELSALMKPLKCDLCNAVMNSTLQAKLHYDGKPHQKKVSMFLNQSVKKQRTEDGQASNMTSDDWQNYCDICKTWFTSQTDATQHYAGKKHIRAANGGPRSRPSKKSQNQNQYNHIDATGRFGIGTAFQIDTQSVATPAIIDSSTVTIPNPAAVQMYTSPPYPTPLRCDLCGVSANRQDQLETHKRGARHLKMLRLNGLPVPDIVVDNENAPSASEPIDYSIYRTPSGQYYCAPCNLSLNSETSFAQHVESKKHKNQSNPKLPNTVVVAKKARFKKK